VIKNSALKNIYPDIVKVSEPAIIVRTPDPEPRLGSGHVRRGDKNEIHNL